MKRIQILPEAVANKIAAGEVVERPASACKELIENAIDAGGKHIRIEIKNGGRSMIRVTDDGCGMNRDDALLCLERHATSKIKIAADIDRIQTLGFRGEAIPSLAAVSHFRLVTREPDALAGTEVEVHGGKIYFVREAGCPTGTQVEIRQLFFNVPARKKFLRSEQTELSHIHQLGLLYALAYPSIHFLLRHNDQSLFEVAAAKDLKERIRSLQGNEVLSQLLPVDAANDQIHITGFVAKPGFCRSSRKEMHFFVNGRPAESRAIYYGAIEGYHNALMKGKYPVCYLFLEIDPAHVDVNIHPAKREVRFRNEAVVQGDVVAAVRKALQQVHDRPLSVPATEPVQPNRVDYNTGQVLAGNMRVEESFRPGAILWPPRPEGLRGVGEGNAEKTETGSKLETASKIAESDEFFAIHGIVAQLYIIAENRHGLVIVDQHAAHERILYETVLNHVSTRSAPSQKLLLPQTVELNPADFACLKDQISLLETMGFGISEFGKNSFMVDALPPYVPSHNLHSLFRSVVDAIEEAGRDVNRDRFREDVIAKTVCRAAIKANDPLKPHEAERLLKDLLKCKQPYCCPHGRPTMIQITREELEKKFGRRE